MTGTPEGVGPIKVDDFDEVGIRGIGVLKNSAAAISTLGKFEWISVRYRRKT
ncbi:hypothetical protein PH547_26500 [Rhizobium sp. CNPSo 3464]|uniref:hypothetical protein n=1 Tax=Rhizobium sp. CNPSo 3464 TaxID=3021406 RepID=UPI00254CB4DB|nr:hypothetical protein [Rhizobium sp. CNPSo 3464]MDK4742447.1 hypothetical protein [Rhizobium sp. CNPSo 3464]